MTSFQVAAFSFGGDAADAAPPAACGDGGGGHVASLPGQAPPSPPDSVAVAVAPPE
jgi:hypothetical protein